MELKIMTLDGTAAGTVDLPEAIFGLEPRSDILHRCVRWQLANRQRGTHDVKNRSEINRTGKKMYRQKGTGSARHGPARVNLFRGGGRSFGPTPRSHAIGLPKKVRALALRHALSAKAGDGGIIVLDQANLRDAKTKALQASLKKLGLAKALIVDREFSKLAKDALALANAKPLVVDYADTEYAGAGERIGILEHFPPKWEPVRRRKCDN